MTDDAFRPDYTSDDVHDGGCTARGYVIGATDPEGWGQAPQHGCPEGCACECHARADRAAAATEHAAIRAYYAADDDH